MHEMIHTFRNSQWDTRLDNTNWDDDIFFRTGINNLIDSSGKITVSASTDGTRRVIVGDMQGGTIYGESNSAVLVGTSFGNNFILGDKSDIALGGLGNDAYTIIVGGGVDTINDEGGSDVLRFSSNISNSSLSLLQSSDGKGLSIYINNELEAQILSNSTGVVIESVEISGITFSLNAFITGSNTAPIAFQIGSDAYGFVNAGMIGKAEAYDSDGDNLHYNLTGISGDYADLGWSVDNEGYIYTNFNRASSSNDQFTILDISVTDGIYTNNFEYTVHWGEIAPNWLTNNVDINQYNYNFSQTDLFGF